MSEFGSEFVVAYERAADGTISAYTPNYPIAVSARGPE